MGEAILSGYRQQRYAPLCHLIDGDSDVLGEKIGR